MCMWPWRRDEERNLRYREVENAYIAGAGRVAARQRIGGQARRCTYAVLRRAQNKVGLYATRASNYLGADGGKGQETGCRELEPSANATVSMVICSCDDGGRCWKLVGRESKDASDHGVTRNASGYFVRRGSPVMKWPEHPGTVCLACPITTTALLINPVDTCETNEIRWIGKTPRRVATKGE